LGWNYKENFSHENLKYAKELEMLWEKGRKERRKRGREGGIERGRKGGREGGMKGVREK
jgi:hypothetical protein